MAQDKLFVESEADAYFRRNPDSLVAVGSSVPTLAALALFDLPKQGTLLDIGGSTGLVAAGFLRDHPLWKAYVVEPSNEAITAGQAAFPQVEFYQGTITRSLPPEISDSLCTVIVVSSVYHWIERSLLSRAIANTDSALADEGYLVVADFDGPFPRANPYIHRPGLFTYKQDYTSCFLALGIYHLVYRRSYESGSASNPDDNYDRQWMTAVLRKDLDGRYAKPTH
jgi:SAM-dependent methyltransferase